MAFSNYRIAAAFKEVCVSGWFVCVELIRWELQFSTTLQSGGTALLLKDFTLSPGFYGFGPASVTCTIPRGRCEIMQKLAIWTWFRAAHGRDVSFWEWLCGRFEGRSLALSSWTLQITSQDNVGFLLCSQIPVCLFGSPRDLFFMCASRCGFSVFI